MNSDKNNRVVCFESQVSNVLFGILIFFLILNISRVTGIIINLSKILKIPLLSKVFVLEL